MANAEQSFPGFKDPEHVVTAAGENGITPAVWSATNQDDVGMWKSVDRHSGVLTSDLNGHDVTPFPDTGRWQQT